MPDKLVLEYLIPVSYTHLDVYKRQEEAITEALAESAQGRGYVIDCAINADEMVHPMVNGGHHITEFLLS